MGIPFDTARPVIPDLNQWHFAGDWSTFAGALPVKVCLARVMNGDTGGVDSKFEQHRDGAKRHGLVFGGYCYSTRGVEQFLREFPPQEQCFPIVDYEGHSTPQDAETTIGKLQAEWGRLPWFYGRRKWIDDGQPRDTIVQQCPYWGAEYGPELKVPDGVGTPVLWQCRGGRMKDGSNPGPEQAPRTFRGVEGGDCDINMVIVEDVLGFTGQMAGGEDFLAALSEEEQRALYNGITRLWNALAGLADIKHIQRPASLLEDDGESQHGWASATIEAVLGPP